jgi:hypothetical protein
VPPPHHIHLSQSTVRIQNKYSCSAQLDAPQLIPLWRGRVIARHRIVEEFPAVEGDPFRKTKLCRPHRVCRDDRSAVSRKKQGDKMGTAARTHFLHTFLSKVAPARTLTPHDAARTIFVAMLGRGVFQAMRVLRKHALLAWGRRVIDLQKWEKRLALQLSRHHLGSPVHCDQTRHYINLSHVTMCRSIS